MTAITVTPGHAAAFMEAALDGNLPRARGVVRAALSRGASANEILAQVLAPSQRRVGKLWEQAAISVAQEHVATAITEQCIDGLGESAPDRQMRGRVLLTGTEGEWHTLGARMVASVWRCAGFDVVAMTPSLPAADVGDLARQDPATVAAVSCALPSQLVQTWYTISALRTAGLKVVVGGRAFDTYPHLGVRLGADLHVTNAFDACTQVSEWTPLPKVPRAAVGLAGADDVERVLSDYERIVSGAVTLVLASSRAHLDGRYVRQHMELLALAALSAALTEEPDVVLDHGQWLRRRLVGEGHDATVVATMADSLVRVLPVDTTRVRQVLSATMHV